MKNVVAPFLLLSASLVAPAFAATAIPEPCPCQPQFDAMAEDAIALVDYKALNPAEATGLAGFGIGIVGSYLPVESSDWSIAAGEDVDGLAFVGLQVTKGLPLDLDVGAFYSYVPGTNIKAYGGELRYAILPGSTVSPALALRGSYSTVTGVENLDLSSTAVDLSLSKGFTFVTPYVGVGYLWGKAEPGPGTTLAEHDSNQTKAFVGLRLTLALLGITPEVERIGNRTLYNLRVGFSF
ncbi:MAG TPA: hypothetical protein VM369_01830 [Candidatus Binatia bacterium]|nr:hypothetical protein [Candidatus Binatia bacterium]